MFSNEGYCYICDEQVTFSAQHEWFRDHYKCNKCGSIPRERALMYSIEKFYPNWKNLSIHESSPGNRGASIKLKTHCAGYIGTQYFPETPLGQIHSSGWRNENLEEQTFADKSFDLVITQDVMEHVFHPEKAFLEIARTLKPGGAHIFTVPLLNQEKSSTIAAQKEADGTITYFVPAVYHGNPVDSKGALVTQHWGYDICDFILKHSGLYTTIVYIDNLELGIRAAFIEVLMSRKLEIPMTISDTEWFNLMCQSQYREVSFDGRILPKFPSVQLQAQTTGASGEQTLKRAFDFYQLCISSCTSLQKSVNADSMLLDFGVGWGRISRFFLREIPVEHIFGLDVQTHLIALCKDLFSSDNFIVSPPFPPSSLADGQFTHIVGYSVFSHLAEKACRAWMEEFHRILQPGGVVILTTRGRAMINYCEKLKKEENLSSYAKGLSMLFDDFDQARSDYDAGRFLHSNLPEVTGGGQLSADFYGETFIPEGYARQAYADLFDLVKFIPGPEPAIATMVFVKKAGGVPGQSSPLS